MRLEVPYGQSSIHLELNDTRPVEIVSPKDTPPNESSIAKSLYEPCNFQDLSSFLSKRRKILVVINDHTRPTPTSTVLKHLDLKENEVTTIIATGGHRSPTQAEIERLLGGRFPPYGGKVLVHNARDDSQLKPAGRTERGTELSFNKALFASDGIIVVGSVEPHYMAGYTGGRKYLLPGLAGIKSIEMNHFLALDESARILMLGGNPVHEDFMEALDLFDRYEDTFSIQLVLNSRHEVGYAFSGHIVHSFELAVKRAKEIYAIPVQSKADVVISVTKPPMDLDLYQSQKAIDNVKLALEDQGVLILVSQCRDGIGDRGFYDALASGGDTLAKIRTGYRYGYHKAAKLAEILTKTRIFVVSDLPPETLTAISMKPYKNVWNALEDAAKLKGKTSRLLVVLDGSITVPIPTGLDM